MTRTGSKSSSCKAFPGEFPSAAFSLRAGGALALAALLLARGGAGADEGRIEVRLDGSEAAAVLGIAERNASGHPPSGEDWNSLFEGEPYLRLKEREGAFQAPFSDDDFTTFVLSKDVAQKAPELRHALEEWKRVDVRACAERALQYLPEGARIQAKVFLLVKPHENSFVYGGPSDPTIFLSVKPGVSRARFENTVIHEMHHIGLDSVSGREDGESLPGNLKPIVSWMEAFGEGFAMLAAAGGPDVHPNAHSTPVDRARWDRDMARFPEDQGALNQFFLDILHGTLTGDEIKKKAASFFGVQGPWYTVGYKMAVVIEKRWGRPRLVAGMVDPHALLKAYNEAAQESTPPLPLWSEELIAALRAPEPAVDPEAPPTD